MRRDGPPAQTTAAVPVGREGQVGYVGHMGQEETDPAWAEQVERARLQGALLVARTMAHELNNSLAPVLGYAELLLERPAVARDSQAVAYASAIARAASDTAAKIRRFQRLSRLVERPSVIGPEDAVLDLERSTEDVAAVAEAAEAPPVRAASGD